MPYLVGATLWVATPEVIAQTDRLPTSSSEAGVTVIDTVPTLLASSAGRAGPARHHPGRRGAAGLDRPALVARSDRRIFNTYGPTEATVVATAWEVSAGEPVTIGRPIANYTCYVVGRCISPAAAGRARRAAHRRPGRGAGLSRAGGADRGEVHRQSLRGDGIDPVLYRSGDAVSSMPAGSIVFHGRIDDQVKIRGFRVELGEIEAKLDELEDVAPGGRRPAQRGRHGSAGRLRRGRDGTRVDRMPVAAHGLARAGCRPTWSRRRFEAIRTNCRA